MRLKRLIYGSLFSLFLLLILSFHPYFTIKDISFEGENFISDTAIMMRTEPLLGSSILWWGCMGGLKRHLIDEFSQIDTVAVTVDYPDKIRFSIEEKPVRLSFLLEGEPLFISYDGTILNKDKQANAYIQNLEDIMIIKGVPVEVFQGLKVEKTALEKIDKLVTLIDQHLNHLTLQVDCEDVVLSATGLTIKTITLLKDDHIPIYIGTMKQLSQKFLNLSNFFKFYEKSDSSIEYIDLRVSDRVIVSYE